jgi:hypothetical protein
MAHANKNSALDRELLRKVVTLERSNCHAYR